MLEKKIKTLLFTLISFFAFFWIFKFFNGEEAIDNILMLKGSIFIVILIHVPTLFFDSLGWRLLIKKNNMSLMSCFYMTWISQTAGKIIPAGAVTGEFVRIYLGTKRGLTWSESSSTVMLDLALASFSLLLIVILCSLTLFFSSDGGIFLRQNLYYLFFLIFLVFIFSVMFGLLIRKRFISYLIKRFRKKKIILLQKKKIFYLLRFDYRLYKLSFDVKRLSLALIIKIVGWFAGAFEIYVFFLLLGIDVNLIDVLVIESFTAIIKSIAFFIPAGIGVQELAFIIAGDYVGLSSTVALTAAIGRRIREVFVGIPALILWNFVHRIK